MKSLRIRCQLYLYSIKHPGTPVPVGIEFDAPGIRELTAVIRQDHREQFNKCVRAQFRVQPVEDIGY